MKKSEPKFIINKEKRTIVCILNPESTMYKRIKKYTSSNSLLTLLPSKYYEFEPVFKGIAKCAPEDEWDEAYGKRLAEYRAYCKKRRYINETLQNFINKVRKSADDIEKYGMFKKAKYPEPPRGKNEN